jgi:CheY-like chemotaxis protein
MDDWQDQRVMVVEDDVLARAALVSLLESWGLHVLPARDLAAACQHLAEGKVPACIVSDYRLQDDINGVELVQHLRGLMGVLTPACIISGDTDPSLIQSVQAMGLTLLHKPVRPAKLRTLLRRLLTQSVLPK